MGHPAQLTSPLDRTSFSGTAVTFQWNAAGGATDYRIEVGSSAGASDVFARSYGNADWTRLILAPSGDTSAQVRLGDHLVGDPAEWTTLAIPLAAYPAGAWEDITHLSLFSDGAAASEILLARVEFRVPNGSSFDWFGDPQRINNAIEDSAALQVTREAGD